MYEHDHEHEPKHEHEHEHEHKHEHEHEHEHKDEHEHEHKHEHKHEITTGPHTRISCQSCRQSMASPRDFVDFIECLSRLDNNIEQGLTCSSYALKLSVCSYELLLLFLNTNGTHGCNFLLR
ncbi:hypothetical protein FHG87_018894 [Trinorchestia longiramus]|nr:hypothetical protein FHG87_018894 [Trinorchestia longiramus]